MKVILKEAAYAEGRLCAAGETVDVPDAVAAEFGDVVAETSIDLRKLSKTQLQAICAERQIPFTADDNKEELAARIENA